MSTRKNRHRLLAHLAPRLERAIENGLDFVRTEGGWVFRFDDPAWRQPSLLPMH